MKNVKVFQCTHLLIAAKYVSTTLLELPTSNETNLVKLSITLASYTFSHFHISVGRRCPHRKCYALRSYAKSMQASLLNLFKNKLKIALIENIGPILLESLH